MENGKEGTKWQVFGRGKGVHVYPHSNGGEGGEKAKPKTDH